MTVSITRTADPAGVAADGSGNNVYSSQSIGAAAADRIVVMTFGTDGTGSLDLATIDFGGGAVNMNLAVSTSTFMGTAIYWYPAPTGTTATFTISGNGVNFTAGDNHISIFRVVGADLRSPIADTATMSSTDMTVTPLSLVVTQVASYAGIAIANTESQATVFDSWSGYTEDLDEDAGLFRYGTAFGSALSGDITVVANSSVGAGTNGGMSVAVFKPPTNMLSFMFSP